ncbi:bifunctional hydroxymethylpyrimidine kinase/phosphomethylpyrimidine kinase [Pukyongiella litopenaei]|uniref:hydroxymethylpyrimidine kinase n=1 Tax=Pukyongiella litopenaei TaxID=2605946 RepID=A0A2S0MSQ1_9RHOB|nr:bifunctional hydroxymethylpyrimidine kinase/phosphomethylpyrimidine kinase [Pukyongiella litopenaei]AVO38713.1 hydroxymethylpyrimidine/phosphomethylpyrimidine kinase [Pukyongiella litopenaei]
MSGAVLFIGGMDSSGGAGLLRDCAAAAEVAAEARVAVTAVTAQDDRAVTAIHPVPPEMVTAQITAADDVAAIKIGMLCSARIVDAVAAALPRAPRVLDPVLKSSSGRDLLDAEGVDLLVERLLPATDLLTPNLPELAVLARHLGVGAADETACIEALFARGCGAVLVKGGHAAPSPVSEDRLYVPGAPPARFTRPRIGVAVRGTGCFLASAIAAHLARGCDLYGATDAAKALLHARFLRVAAGAASRDHQALPVQSH